jgi:hypothetical protein
VSEELENQKAGLPDVEGHKAHGKAHGVTEDSEPDEAKTKLANDEDDDVEAHKQHPKQHAG